MECPVENARAICHSLEEIATDAGADVFTSHSFCVDFPLLFCNFLFILSLFFLSHLVAISVYVLCLFVFICAFACCAV